MTAIILAGGQSSRLGQDKAWLKIDGQSIIQRVLAKLTPLFNEVIIVGVHSPRFHELGVGIVPDELPGQGPLGGLYTGLRASKSEWLFCCACDMPFLNKELIAALARQANQADAVICEWKGKLQPLHAFYNKSCLPVIKGQLKNQQNRMREIFQLLQVRYLDENFIVTYAPQGNSFFNLNTSEALDQAKKIARITK